MATRVNLPQLSVPDIRRRRACSRMASRSAGRPKDARLANRDRTLVVLVRHVPPLPFPARNPQLPPGGLAGDWVVDGIERIITRVWIQRSLAIVARGIWLTLFVGCLWLLVDLLGGPALRLPILHRHWSRPDALLAGHRRAQPPDACAGRAHARPIVRIAGAGHRRRSATSASTFRPTASAPK